jgi:hypothetical protein
MKVGQLAYVALAFTLLIILGQSATTSFAQILS